MGLDSLKFFLPLPNIDEPKMYERSCEYHILIWAKYTHECSSMFGDKIEIWFPIYVW